jgi:hypothetical protein
MTDPGVYKEDSRTVNKDPHHQGLLSVQRECLYNFTWWPKGEEMKNFFVSRVMVVVALSPSIESIKRTLTFRLYNFLSQFPSSPSSSRPPRTWPPYTVRTYRRTRPARDTTFPGRALRSTPLPQ